ncbi:hypothetical protein GCM10011583_68010 [Streptomyces camponoticapitis]|uniref:Acyl-CoA carboxylase subunit epsilon n=1 Tax=Streptomyces camponoticapitis TaxID=1616125 RepID=A0ABQ2EX46_9ACTN|nr:hypothetical protein GCM10011583_68010 [Streptomyces camponoticapitis]
METTGTEHVVRVEKGNPDDEELAAVIAVVLACAATADGDQDESDESPGAAFNWRPTERESAYRGPRAWRHIPPATSLR